MPSPFSRRPAPRRPASCHLALHYAVRGALLAPVALALAGCALVPTGKRRAEERRPATTAPGRVAPSAQGQQCLARLSATGARFDPLPDRYLGAGCSQLGTIQFASLGGDDGTIAISHVGPVTCATGEALERWARYGVDRAARQILRARLARVETMGSYSCRNVAGTGRRSAHSRAEAVDIAAFVLADGRRVSVLEDWDGGTREERAFLRTVHESACKRFATVLGPDYNAAHRDHLHLEWGDGSFCR